MATIGNKSTWNNYSKFDDISSSFNGALTQFNLTVNGNPAVPASELAMRVFLNNVEQEPKVAYTVSADVITFSSAPTGGTTFWGAFAATADIGTPADDSVSTIKLKNSSVILSKVNFVLDEDDMISNSDTDVSTQQSTKAYIDNRFNNTYATSTSLQAVASLYPTYTNITGLNPSLVAKNNNPWIRIVAQVTLTTTTPNRGQYYKTNWSGTGVTSGNTGIAGGIMPGVVSSLWQSYTFQHVVQITCSAGNTVNFQSQLATSGGDSVNLRGDEPGSVCLYIEELNL